MILFCWLTQACRDHCPFNPSGVGRQLLHNDTSLVIVQFKPTAMERRKLTVGQRWQIVGLCRKGGWSQARAAVEFNISQSAVSKILKKERDTHDVCDRHRSGRPRKTDPDENDVVIQYAEQHPFSSARDMQQHLGRSLGQQLARVQSGGDFQMRVLGRTTQPRAQNSGQSI